MKRVIYPAVLFVLVTLGLLMIPIRAQASRARDFLNEDEQNKKAPVVQSSLQLKLSGYAQLQAAWKSEDNDTFSIRRARLSLGGQVLKTLKFKIQVDFTRSPVLVDAQAEFTPNQVISLRAGQFLVPFSLENITSSSDLLTINRSQVVEKLAPGRDTGSAGRDLGAAIFGSYSIFDYSIGLFNGSGANKADTNDHKDLAGRLVAHPWKPLSLAFSIYNGKQTVSDSPVLIRRNRYGLELAFSYQRLGLQAEFIRATDDRTEKEGWYTLATYSLLRQKVQLVGRLEAINLDRHLPAQKTTIYTAGVNWFLTEKSKLQANYEYHQTASGPDRQAALLLLQVGF